MLQIPLSQTGQLMPTVGLGTWQAPAEVIEATVGTALNLGYRHIDTAFNYNNEEAIGVAIKNWIDSGKGTREQLFITTKLPHIGNRASDVQKFLKMQLERLQMSYVDLYLIHVPFAFNCDSETLAPKVNGDGNYELDTSTDHVATWKAMEICQKEGLTKNIGLSNFNEAQIDKIFKAATFKPQVLQVEMHAYCQQKDLKEYCKEKNILLTGYAPLGSPGAKEHFVNKYNYSPETFPDLLSEPSVLAISKKYNKSPAQVMLQYFIKHGIVVIPKSTIEVRLKENIDLFNFELSPEDLEQIKSLDKGEKGRIFDFKFWKGVENHPEYPFKELV